MEDEKWKMYFICDTRQTLCHSTFYIFHNELFLFEPWNKGTGSALILFIGFALAS
jgi:hypothetical protein